MIRTQIQLTAQQLRRLRSKARLEGVSLAEVIRRCIDRSLEAEVGDRTRLYTQASRLVGQFKDRRRATDLAEDHDRYLDEESE